MHNVNALAEPTDCKIVNILLSILYTSCEYAQCTRILAEK